MAKDVNYYLSKGFDSKTAQYFANGRKRITNVIALDNFSLIITFDNSEQRLLDVAPIIKDGGIFNHLKDLKIFSRVYLDDEHCIAWDIDPNIDSKIVWNNKIDLCPDTCYLDSISISSDDFYLETGNGQVHELIEVDDN